MRRPLAVAAAALAACLGASACDSSPYAASVNGSVIKQTALNVELAQQSSNRAYVTAVDQANANQGFTIEGQSKGSYNSAWVATVLEDAIAGKVLDQHLAATHQVVPPGLLDAATSVDLAAYGTVWAGFPSAYRQVLVQRDAANAFVQAPPPSSELSALRQVYDQNKKYFFTQVCVRQIAVSVTAPDGSVDDATSLADAQQLVATFDATGQLSGPGEVSGGAVTCYSPQTLFDQPVPFIEAVFGLAPGQAGNPTKATYGYNVLAVVSRASIAYDTDVAKALAVKVDAVQGIPNTALDTLLDRAHVKVNPQYGTWETGKGSASPQIVPPGSTPSPASSATSSASTAG